MKSSAVSVLCLLSFTGCSAVTAHSPHEVEPRVEWRKERAYFIHGIAVHAWNAREELRLLEESVIEESAVFSIDFGGKAKTKCDGVGGAPSCGGPWGPFPCILGCTYFRPKSIPHVYIQEFRHGWAADETTAHEILHILFYFAYPRVIDRGDTKHTNNHLWNMGINGSPSVLSDTLRMLWFE